MLLDPIKFRYLDAIIDPNVEVDNKEKKKRAEAAISLTWLKRIMDFILYFLSTFVLEVRFIELNWSQILIKEKRPKDPAS